MPRSPVTILCLASYFKGHDFIRECHRLGARVLLVTRESLRDLEWPRESIDELLLIPDTTQRDHMINLMRDERESRWEKAVLARSIRAFVHGPAQRDGDMAHRGRSFNAALAFASRTRCSTYS